MLLFFLKPEIVIARNVLAGYLALKCRNKRLVKTVVYDGRGAISAEWNEYEVVNKDQLKKNIETWEKYVVLKSDKQIAVSEKLVAYWKTQFGFSDMNAFVIPCTLDNVYESLELNEKSNKELKKNLGFNPDDILLVFSGSTAGWQSADLLYKFLTKQLNLQPNISVLFLSKDTTQIALLKKNYSGRIVSTFLPSDQVPDYLMACDYGLLIREDTVTNEVASPVKFAEYLACGLKVIISPKIGDYSKMVVENGIGILSNQMQAILEPVSIKEKRRCRDFALTHFTKSRYINVYKSILNISNPQ